MVFFLSVSSTYISLIKTVLFYAILFMGKTNKDQAFFLWIMTTVIVSLLAWFESNLRSSTLNESDEKFWKGNVFFVPLLFFFSSIFLSCKTVIYFFCVRFNNNFVVVRIHFLRWDMKNLFESGRVGVYKRKLKENFSLLNRFSFMSFIHQWRLKMKIKKKKSFYLFYKLFLWIHIIFLLFLNFSVLQIVHSM